MVINSINLVQEQITPPVFWWQEQLLRVFSDMIGVTPPIFDRIKKTLREASTKIGIYSAWP